MVAAVDHASEQVINAGFKYVKVHTQHAIFTACVVLVAAWTGHEYLFATKAEGAELTRVVKDQNSRIGNIELMLTELRIETKEKQLRRLLNSGDTGIGAGMAESELKAKLRKLRARLVQLEAEADGGNVGTPSQ